MACNPPPWIALVRRANGCPKFTDSGQPFAGERPEEPLDVSSSDHMLFMNDRFSVRECMVWSVHGLQETT